MDRQNDEKIYGQNDIEENERQMDRQKDKRMDGRMGKHIVGQTNGLMERQMDGKTNGQSDRLLIEQGILT